MSLIDFLSFASIIQLFTRIEIRQRILKRALLASVAIFVFTACVKFNFAAEHPGNVFVTGDEVRISVPADWEAWQAIDVDGKVIGSGNPQNGWAELGELPIGYYEVLPKEGPAKITAAVLEKVTPMEDTPIAIDTAMSWFYAEPEKIRDACELCKLAGVKWIRERSSWPEIEIARGSWAPDGKYEQAMRIEQEEGLKVLQVNHISPAWATEDAKRFPDDLRDVYNFYRGLAERWKGLTDAIEPWNEPDIKMFGGHTGSEIASFHKAAYLGLKAGNPEQPVCGTVFAIDRAETLEEFGANKVYPYFDRYDLHHYIGLPVYSRAYQRHRNLSGGRPLWTTEFNLPVLVANAKTQEPSSEDLRVQGFRVGKVFAQALHEGSEKAFYFILGHYVERNLQFGLLHHDLTPRPAYVAFAAVGRLLNGAKPIGRVDLGDEKLKGYVFKAMIDGAERETMVAWSETFPTTINIASAEKVYDYLGREKSQGAKVELTRSTVYLVLPPGGSKNLQIEPAPPKPEWLSGETCPVVLQLVGEGDFQQSAFHLNEENELRLFAYNFSDSLAVGELSVSGAVAGESKIKIEPGERLERRIEAQGPGVVSVRLELENGKEAIVSARVMKLPSAGSSKE